MVSNHVYNPWHIDASSSLECENYLILANVLPISIVYGINITLAFKARSQLIVSSQSFKNSYLEI